jgi:hypothetical protein
MSSKTVVIIELRFFTDAYFLAPLEKQMRLMSAAGGTVYFYTNDFRFEIL